MPDEVKRDRLKHDRDGTRRQPRSGDTVHDACWKRGQQVRTTQQLQRMQEGGDYGRHAPMAPDAGKRRVGRSLPVPATGDNDMGVSKPTLEVQRLSRCRRVTLSHHDDIGVGAKELGPQRRPQWRRHGDSKVHLSTLKPGDLVAGVPGVEDQVDARCALGEFRRQSSTERSGGNVGCNEPDRAAKISQSRCSCPDDAGQPGKSGV